MQFRQEVKAGAALLDSFLKTPDWRWNIQGMDIADPNNCLLTRIFGGYILGLSILKTGDDIRYGFEVDHGSRKTVEEIKENYALLQKAWEEELANPPLGTSETPVNFKYSI